MNATLCNRDHSEYGVATIPLPIPDEEYAHCMELLEALEIGSVSGHDCYISLYENGENKPEYSRTVALANALRVPTTFFFSEDVCHAETPATYFRSLASATKLTRTSQSLKLEYVAKMYEALLEYWETCMYEGILNSNGFLDILFDYH